MYFSKKTGLLPLLLCAFFAQLLPAQQVQDGVFPDRDHSPITKHLFNILMAHREVEYFGLPLYFNSSQFGRNQDSLPSRHTLPYFEANLAPYYVVLKGRDLQRDWLKRFSIAFEPQMTFRIYLSKGQSFPVRPPNFQPKFHFNYFVHKKLDSLTTRFSHLTLIVAHLSNGQPNPFFEDSINKVVNLKNGNFSTNYLRFGYTFSQYLNPKDEVSDRDGWKSNAFWSASVAYQREINIGTLLTFDEDMDILGYGRNRVVTRLQFRSGNFLGARALFSHYRQPAVYQAVAVPILERDTVVQRDGQEMKLCFVQPYYIVRKIEAKNNKSPKGYWNWMMRWDNALVLDKKAIHRNTADYVFELRNLNWRSFSFIAKCTWGRDYMNLRFGERIHAYQIGISYNMERYKVPYTKYIETLEQGDVIKLNNSRDPDLTENKDRLPDITGVAVSPADEQSYTLYDSELRMRQTLPSAIQLDGSSFERPPCFRLVDGQWVIVTAEKSKLKKMGKRGWYRADDFDFDKAANPE